MNQPSESMTYVFFDTNVFLHCLPIQQMNVPKLLGVDSITLLVAAIMIQELDKHKSTHASGKIRDRARNSLKMIKKYMDSPDKEICPGVHLDYVGRPPSDFEQHGLDINWPDHQLVANVLIHKNSNPSDRVVLISHDTGPQLTAMQLGIELAEIPEEWRIPPEDDPLVKENKRLQKELLKIKNAQPKIILRLSEMSDDDTHHVFEVENPPDIQIPDKNKIIAELRDSYPEKHSPDKKEIDQPNIHDKVNHIVNLLSNSSRSDYIPADEYERYNKQIQQYFSNYEMYLDRLANYPTQSARTLIFDLQIRNIGGAPATDVDVYAHFPDGFSIYTEDKIPKESIEPKPPKEPRTFTQKLAYDAQRRFNTLQPIPSYHNALMPKKTFSLKRTRSYELREHYNRIKHGYVGNIRQIYLIFDSFDAMTPFNFSYEITVGNLPESVTGQLNIVIKKK